MEFNVSKDKISSIFNLPKLGMTRQLEFYAEEETLWENTLPIVNGQYIFGLELETENVKDSTYIKDAKYRSYWNIDTDNSLRNWGKEFISVPLKAFQLEHAIDQLKSCWNSKSYQWTERTSTHVHMNARDLNVSQILNLVLIYCAVEKLLFNWVGHNRNKNIFCIPLYKTWYYRAIGNITTDIYSISHTWNKYTALNLSPLQKYGTIEFRHLYGTWDKEVIIQWTNLISCIKRYAKTKTTHELKELLFSLNTTSTYTEFVLDVFKGHAKVLLENINEGDIQSLMEDPITFCKMCLACQNDTINIPYVEERNGWEIRTPYVRRIEPPEPPLEYTTYNGFLTHAPGHPPSIFLLGLHPDVIRTGQVRWILIDEQEQFNNWLDENGYPRLDPNCRYIVGTFDTVAAITNRFRDHQRIRINEIQRQLLNEMTHPVEEQEVEF